MSQLNIYTIFHLNLMYSSIAEESRAQVVANCYWPILRMAEELNIPIGIELSGLTLKIINEIDPAWVQKFKQLLSEKKVELLGSGYAQIIGPLVPVKVNDWNQKIGLETYQEVLNFQPRLVWVNEQAYSADLVECYLKFGYQAMVMEWNNAFRFHHDWLTEWQYQPQTVAGSNAQRIPVIWNNSIWFQKFQRYVQGETELEEQLNYITNQVGQNERNFALYGSDAEVFDYRPGRYQGELKIENSEWIRILQLYQKLKLDWRFNFIFPSNVLRATNSEHSGHVLTLETAEQPIPVKKQEKYNITRWAVTGRDSQWINTSCYKIYKSLIDNNINEKNEWRQLCFFWSSDFRTHIEEKRWQELLTELLAYEQRLVCGVTPLQVVKSNQAISPHFKIERKQSKLSVETESIKIILNCRKGLVVDELAYKTVDSRPMIGTLPHGYYEDISFGADFFSGHTIVEIPGRPKITDLAIVEPIIEEQIRDNGNVLSLRCESKQAIGNMAKEIIVYCDKPQVEIEYMFDLQGNQPKTLRTGIITIVPTTFDLATLYYQTTNGGSTPQKFEIKQRDFDHGRTISTIISAGHCLGATDGYIEIGDEDKTLKIHSDKAQGYSVPMLQFHNVDNTYFYRLCFSLSEIDETCKPSDSWCRKVKFILTAEKK